MARLTISGKCFPLLILSISPIITKNNSKIYLEDLGISFAAPGFVKHAEPIHNSFGGKLCVFPGRSSRRNTNYGNEIYLRLRKAGN